MALTFGKGNRAIAFAPTSAFPLNANSYFEDLTLAQAAAAEAEEAGSTNTKYYFGQEIVVADLTSEVKTATMYIIVPTGATAAEGYLKGGQLERVGSVVEADGQSIDFNDEGKLQVFGFENLTAEHIGYLPRVKKIVDKPADETAGTPEEYHLEVEWAPVSAIVEGDGDTKTAVVEGTGIKVAATIDDEKDERTYTVSINEEYLTQQIAANTTAAMEFMGAVTEFPTGLTPADKGHFYKVSKEFTVNNNTIIPVEEILTSSTNVKEYIGEGALEGVSNSLLEINIENYNLPKTAKLFVNYEVIDDGDFSVGFIASSEYEGGEAADEYYHSNGEGYECRGDILTFKVCLNNFSAETGEENSLKDPVSIKVNSIIVASTVPVEMQGQTIKVGDSIVWDGYAWYVIPSGDDIEDTWRPITKTVLDENNEEKTTVINSNATLNIKPGLALFDIDDESAATLDLTGLKVKDIAQNTESGFITDITLDEEGIIQVAKSPITIPGITVDPTDGDADTDNAVSVITKLTVNANDNHNLIPEFVNVPTINYVDTKFGDIKIPELVINEGTKPETVTGYTIITEIAKGEGENHQIDVSYSQIPMATTEALGVVKSSSADNQISVGNDGTMTVNFVTTDKLKNGTKTFVIDGGSASVYTN